MCGGGSPPRERNSLLLFSAAGAPACLFLSPTVSKCKHHHSTTLSRRAQGVSCVKWLPPCVLGCSSSSAGSARLLYTELLCDDARDAYQISFISRKCFLSHFCARETANVALSRLRIIHTMPRRARELILTSHSTPTTAAPATL
jgi:hypothetical protein